MLNDKRKLIGQPILHVGLPKTGTTFLQNNFFNKIQEIQFMTPHLNWSEEFKWVYEINKNIEYSLFRDSNKSRGQYFPDKKRNEYIVESIAYLSHIDQRVLVSSEGLCGASFSPIKNNYDSAIFLRDIFGDSKILFIFRQQANYCESIYKQLVFKENRFKRYVKFEEVYSKDECKKSLSKYGELNWHEIYNNYCEVFGVNNVLALPYEYMETDLKHFIFKIQDFMGIEVDLDDSFFKNKENVSKKTYHYTFQNRLEKLFLNPFRKDGLSFSALTQETKIDIMNDVRKSNIKLAEEIDIDLSTYGYF
jgi:hypothetical protein